MIRTATGTCEVCGTAFFYVPRSGRPARRFCSRTCRGISERRPRTLVCRHCGQTFVRYRDGAQFCSVACSTARGPHAKPALRATILQALADGQHPAQIAKRLGISTSTVYYHRGQGAARE